MSRNEKRKASESPAGLSKKAKISILAQEFPNTEARAEFIAAKFSKLLGDDVVFPKILEKKRVNLKHEILNCTYDISEYWFNWAVDYRAWDETMALGKPNTCVALAFTDFSTVQAGKKEKFPWQSVPSSEPKDPSDRALWLPKFKETQSMLASLTSRERLENGLVLMKEEPPFKRTYPGMTSIELRQTIWDDVFPGKPCVKNRPFEFAVPTHVKFVDHVAADIHKRDKQLPPGIRMVVVDAECPEGTRVNCLIFGYKNGTVDNPWNRLLLAAVYKTAVQWAREAFMTRRSIPLSQALASFKVSSFVNGDVKLSDEMEQLSLDKSLVAECDAQLALGPYRNEKAHAEFRVSVWLEKEKMLPAEERCKMLRDWCNQTHVNLEGLTPADQRMACRRAWEAKIQEWTETKPPLYLSWTEEKKFAAEVAK
ncbi:AIG2-like family protein [Colletotrichum tofieldiae]|nr:AIG2-like family protein [Colletotrichum tofieldiae]